MSRDRCETLCLDLPRAEALRRCRPTAEAASRAAARARALTDPTRLLVAAAPHEGGELCVCDLAWVVERAQNLVSHHVRALEARGLATARRETKMVLYTLSDDGRELLEAVLDRSVGARA